jgi:hypothetical protein
MFRNRSILAFVGFLVVAASIYADWGAASWSWFQRSGSVLVLLGALMTYRSILRLGVKGVGGADPIFFKGRVAGIDNSGGTQKVKVKTDEDTQRLFSQADHDKLAGYVGAIFMIFGTIIWGYGDLAGKILH